MGIDNIDPKENFASWKAPEGKNGSGSGALARERDPRSKTSEVSLLEDAQMSHGDSFVEMKFTAKPGETLAPGSKLEREIETKTFAYFDQIGENPKDYQDDPAFPVSNRMKKDSQGREVYTLRLMKNTK